MPRNPEQFGNIPGLPGLPSGVSPPPRRRFAGSWAADEIRFADACLNAWNESAGRDVAPPRANRTRRNHFVAIQLYRWLHGPDNAPPSAVVSGPAPLTESDVLAAIRAYAEDDWIIKHCAGRFMAFGDWLRGGADNVDKQLARIGRRRGQSDSLAVTAGAIAARALLDHLGLGRLAEQAAGIARGLLDYVESITAMSKRYAHRGPSPVSPEAAALVARWRAESVATRQALLARGEKGFAALHGRAPHRQLCDRNVVQALALALLARLPEPRSVPGRATRNVAHATAESEHG